MKKIAILGSTGSIGTQTLEVVRANKDIGVTALAAGSNIDLLEKQIREFSPKIAAVWNEEKAKELKDRVRDLDIRVESGMDGLLAVATELGAEIVVTAVVGMIGIRPTIAAMNAGKDIALANKETLVTAGHIIMSLAKEKHVRILPVDSEHSAIFQCLQGAQGNTPTRLILTASGGPFRTLDEFCRRMVPRDLNRRAVESLIKAGAFDSLGFKRRALLTFWVLKEAQVKRTGDGLRGYPNGTDFSLNDPRVTEMDGCLVAVIE